MDICKAFLALDRPSAIAAIKLVQNLNTQLLVICESEKLLTLLMDGKKTVGFITILFVSLQ